MQPFACHLLQPVTSLPICVCLDNFSINRPHLHNSLALTKEQLPNWAELSLFNQRVMLKVMSSSFCLQAQGELQLEPASLIWIHLLPYLGLGCLSDFLFQIKFSRPTFINKVPSSSWMVKLGWHLYLRVTIHMELKSKAYCGIFTFKNTAFI